MKKKESFIDNVTNKILFNDKIVAQYNKDDEKTKLTIKIAGKLSKGEPVIILVYN